MKPPVKSPSPERPLTALRATSASEQARLGCTDTLREILQQPRSWRTTAALIQGEAWREGSSLRPLPSCIVLTGSGSSLYVGECLAPALQAQLGVPCQAIAAGTLMTDSHGLPPLAGGLLVSIARSGDSPESTGAVDAVLAQAPGWKHLVITCNAEGNLATRYRSEARVRVLLLDPATNDRSLVMTSSFTNLLLAGSGLLPDAGPGNGLDVANVGEDLIEHCGDALARWGALEIDAMVCLGDGVLHGAAHEASLKLLEMSAGAVRVMTETSLGLRHGPMAWLNRPSHLLVFLSGDSATRAYQADLLQELSRKRLGLHRIVVGEGLHPEWIGAEGLGIDLPGLYRLPEPHQAMVHVMVGQLLALFRCLALGQKPDAPSQGVLTRVVKDFPIYRGSGA